ncbi:MAG: aldo/keto reductase [Verrucomicrobiota bacterium]
MERVKLSKGGPEVSRLVYGTWRLLDDEGGAPSAGEVVKRLEACLELGITTLDTAEIYGLYAVEAALGQAFKEQAGLREKFEIVTKCGIDVPSDEKDFARVAHYNATAANMVACAEKSLRLMNTDCLDVLLVHRPDWLTRADETAEGLNRLMKEGKIKCAGVSNYTVHQFEVLHPLVEGGLVTNQVEASVLSMGALYDGTLDQCQRLGICPMAWSPTAGGRLFDPADEAAGRVRKLVEGELSEKYGGATLDQMAFAWLLAHPSRMVPVIGTNKVSRIESAAKGAGIELERQDWYAMWEAAQGESVP